MTRGHQATADHASHPASAAKQVPIAALKTTSSLRTNALVTQRGRCPKKSTFPPPLVSNPRRL
ncbi:MAG: hypothetical protein V3V08_10485 [Nannocystaceae bacterium]